jgi:regulator of cell morphogenesis and NO signaling
MLIRLLVKEECEGMIKIELNTVLSPPLQQLKNEHVLLRGDMNQFYEITEDMSFESGIIVIQLFEQLYQQVAVFTENLKAHSKLEDEWLFPIMAGKLEKNDRTIEVMEFEHEKVEQHLLDFLTEAEQKGKNIDENDAQSLSVHAVQAYATLTQHFAKEEKVLFPLAERLLSNEEKKVLERLFQGR